jgi:hypothetical protein
VRLHDSAFAHVNSDATFGLKSFDCISLCSSRTAAEITAMREMSFSAKGQQPLLAGELFQVNSFFKLHASV